MVGFSAASDELAATAPSSGISPTTINIQPRRWRPQADMAAPSIDARLADYVLARSWDASDHSPTANDHPPAIEDALPAEQHVWAELAVDWNFWPAFTLV